MSLRSTIKIFIPPVLLRRYHAIQIRKGKMIHSGWSGDYTSWAEAKMDCEGYDKKEILDKVLKAVLKVKSGEAAYERDSVAFSDLEYSGYLLDALLESAAMQKGRLHVVDFGGSLGSTYFQYKSLLHDVKDLRWAVVEQSHFVRAGSEHVADDSLSFYTDITEPLRIQEPMVLLLCSVLGYLENPYEQLGKLLGNGFSVVLIDRTGFIEGRNERLTKQTVPESIYKASYPMLFFNEAKFKSFIHNYNYIITVEDDSEFAHPRVLDDGRKVYWKGFVLKKEDHA